jgi:hypothetical protein
VASPLVWLHYFALLIIPVALTRPTLSWPWLLPLALIVCPGTGNGTTAETALPLVILALVAWSTLSTSSTTSTARALPGELADLGGSPSSG